MDAPDIRAIAALQQTVADLERELDAYRETRRAVDAKCVEQRETIASLSAELAAMRDERDGYREALGLIAKQRDWDAQAPVEWLDLFVRVARKAVAPSPASAPRETAEQSTRSTNPQSKE